MWTMLEELARFESPWIRLIGERWRSDDDDLLEYWRTEGADSLIVIPRWRDSLLLPARVFRPGVGQYTLDFPGGRMPGDIEPNEAAYRILQRELGVPREAVVRLVKITHRPLLVNSSTSDQQLSGYFADLDASMEASVLLPHQCYPLDESGKAALLEELVCLQCRGLLLEWLSKNE